MISSDTSPTVWPIAGGRSDSCLSKCYLRVSECNEPDWNTNLALRFLIESLCITPPAHPFKSKVTLEYRRNFFN